MLTIIVIGIIGGVVLWIYKAGKRDGSRLGFNAGRYLGRRGRRS